MSLKRIIRLLGIGAVLALLLGAVSLMVILRVNERTEPKGPSIYVPPIFKLIRENPGHVTHVQDQKFACMECHGTKDSELAPPSVEVCAKCHADKRITVHPNPIGQAATDCLSCHNFSAERSLQPLNCIRCHAKPQGYARAIVTHAKETCLSCHNPHREPSLQPRACPECHQDKSSVEHGRGVPGASLCLDCHRSHDTKNGADQVCSNCHNSTSRPMVPVTARFKGHDKCIGCHQPHYFVKKKVKTCKECHDKQRTLGAFRGRARKHMQCSACHELHNAGPVAAEENCRTCHKKTQPAHPPDEHKGKCLGCHPVHELQKLAGTSAAVACYSCHREATSDRKFHTDKTRCADCHKPHAFSLKGQGKAFCNRCHEDKVKAVVKAKGHDQCLDCHTVAAHNPDKKPPECTDCHNKPKMPLPAGHTACSQCHLPHETKRDAARCGNKDCHPDRKSSRHGNTKNGCRDCHIPHAAKGSIGKPKMPSCQSCHKNIRKVTHDNIEDGCRACHNPHDALNHPTVARCKECHPDEFRPSMHQHKDHQTCFSCHKGHERRPSGYRESCLTECHEEVRQHEPTAKKCTGCHLFRVPGKPVRIPGKSVRKAVPRGR